MRLLRSRGERATFDVCVCRTWFCLGESARLFTNWAFKQWPCYVKWRSRLPLTVHLATFRFPLLRDEVKCVRVPACLRRSQGQEMTWWRGCDDMSHSSVGGHKRTTVARYCVSGAVPAPAPARSANGSKQGPFQSGRLCAFGLSLIFFRFSDARAPGRTAMTSLPAPLSPRHFVRHFVQRATRQRDRYTAIYRPFTRASLDVRCFQQRVRTLPQTRTQTPALPKPKRATRPRLRCRCDRFRPSERRAPPPLPPCGRRV